MTRAGSSMVNIRTGGDIHSKVGIMHASVQTNPEQYLSNFGETTTLSEEDISLAEEHLVKVRASVKAKPCSKTFDEYRSERYTGGSRPSMIYYQQALLPGHIFTELHIHCTLPVIAWSLIKLI